MGVPSVVRDVEADGDDGWTGRRHFVRGHAYRVLDGCATAKNRLEWFGYG
jgi:hypothetical protein